MYKSKIPKLGEKQTETAPEANSMVLGKNDSQADYNSPEEQFFKKQPKVKLDSSIIALCRNSQKLFKLFNLFLKCFSNLLKILK